MPKAMVDIPQCNQKEKIKVLTQVVKLIYNNNLLKIEAKLLKDTRSNSANFFNLLGEAMSADKKSNILTQYNTVYSAFLIPRSSKGTFDTLWQKKISVTVGNKYCNNFTKQ